MSVLSQEGAMFPRILEIGPVTLHSYGFLLALACLAAIALTSRLAEREGVPRERTWDLGFIVILSAVIGAKLLLVLSDWDTYLAEPARLVSVEFLQAGGVFYGGLLGAVAGSALYMARSRDLRFWAMADVAAPAIALGQAIGRLGCFAAGCDYGRPADLPWAVTFTSEYAHRYVGVPIHVALHPAQLYESAVSFALFLALLGLLARRRFRGQIFCLYLIFYSVARFGLEFFRGDADRGFVFDGLLSTSQFISLLILPAAVIGYRLLSRRETRA